MIIYTFLKNIYFFCLKCIDILNYLFLWTIYWLSGFFPRNPKIWVFGNGTGYSGNSKALFEYLLINKTDISVYWVTNDVKVFNILLAKSFPVIKKTSIEGIYLTFRSKIRFSCISNDDVNFWTGRNSIRVQLWHGIPLKKIGKSSKIGLYRDVFQNKTLYKRLYKFQEWYIQASFIVSPSEYVKNYSYVEAFDIQPDQIIILGDARLDTFVNNSKKLSTRKIIYMPTFRAFDPDFLVSQIPIIKSITKLLSSSEIEFHIKLHPYTPTNSLNYLMVESPETRIYSTNDIYENLNDFELLISDYSSIMIDFAVLKRPTISYRYDEKNYHKFEREMYLDIKDLSFIQSAVTDQELLEMLKEYIANPKSKRFEIDYDDVKRFHFYGDGKTCERHYEFFGSLLNIV